MKYNKRNIVKISKVAPVVIYDATDDKKYLNKSGVHIIEYDDASISTLDLTNNVDLTNIDNIEIDLFSKSKIKVIFDISINDKKLELADVVV